LFLVVAVALLGVLAMWLGGRESESTQTVRSALSPQNCITACQTRQTDCILECDGVVPCEKRCVVEGQRCVRGCRGGADAGPH
jgi:hypothetical protein